MLFDLRGKGRRRAIRVIYLGLAILLGGGLVFFGIGGSVSGGLFDAIGLTNSNGGGRGGGTDIFAKRATAVEKRLKINPRNEADWALLAKTRFQQAGQGDGYDQNNSVYTDKGKQKLDKAAVAWNRYLALKPAKPDPTLARFMTQAFGPGGLSRLPKAAEAAEIVTQTQPSSAAFYQLALYAYAAGQSRKADLASAQALAKAPKDSRAALKDQLAQAKQQGTALAARQGQQQGAPTPVPPG